MREIKFRGRQIVDNEWAYGFVVITNMSGVFILDVVMKSVKNKDGVNIGDIISQHEIDGATLGQYTGLHDKNGKEIYEGDILCDTEDGKKWRIEFYWGQFCATDLLEPFLGHILWSLAEHAEVVGNIHEVAP